MNDMELKKGTRRSGMLQLFGILIIVNILIFDLWWIVSQNSRSGTAITFLTILTAFILLAGLVLIFNQRATELSFGKYGSLKVAADQVKADANEIAEIRKRAEAQSATIDLVAEQATKAKEASEQVALKNEKAEEKLAEINTALIKAKENLASLESYSNYYAIVLAAQGEDRMAYDQLGKWAAILSFPLRTQALHIYQKIMDDHSQGMFYSGFTVNWKEGVDPNELTFEELKQVFLSLNQDPYQRRALLEYIWKRNNIPKIDRLDFLVNVLRNEKHLMVCEYAGRYFTEGAELKIKPLALDHLINWWEENRGKFEGKPDPNAEHHQHN
jgi:flagellar biosynthesis chaperone FliJ